MKRPLPYCRFMLAAQADHFVRRNFTERERRDHPEVRLMLANFDPDDGTGESVDRVVSTPSHFAVEVARLHSRTRPLFGDE